MAAKPILEIPPFPRARSGVFAELNSAEEPSPSDAKALLSAIAQHRVGGYYWGPQKELPSAGFVLDGTGDHGDDSVVWGPRDDPWHLLAGAQYSRLKDDDPRALLAIAAGVPLVLVCANHGTVRDATDYDATRLTQRLLTGWRFRSPFDGAELTAMEAIRLCAFWRRLIDANRSIHAIKGIAYWKKPTVTPLLWGGAPVPYNRPLDNMAQDTVLAVWRSRLSSVQKRAIATIDPVIAEIEDGFIRSAGLGADCVPPLSIILDRRGVHFDPTAPSEIEDLLQEGNFSADLIARARALRKTIIASGLSKYETGAHSALSRPGGERRHILVPGQVEDDRAVTSGGALSSNLELLRRAREEAGPDAYLIYKPHPDVLAGHRRGLITEAEMALLADRVETASPMAALIAMVDELHVNSSLAGFEGLLRGKRVTVHGAPFYAGWGLTIDRGMIPARRTAKRTLDELVAAALLLYPRYLDPVTGLPCPAEVLVERLAGGPPKLDPAVRTMVAFRRTAGRIRRVMQA